ncbi:MAG: TMEM165/GDT1 family protein [Alphaproteobacteria bacterium]
MLEALLTSVVVVALAEVGDKTQLLALMLTLRFQRPLAIIAGMFAATLANHAGAAWLGEEATQFVEGPAARLIVAASFVAIGLWALKPDRLHEDQAPKAAREYGAFLSTLVGFFLVEMGDKTQLATMVLAAHYRTLAAVIAGTTAGMLLANVPVVLAGQAVLRFLPLRAVRIAAAILFVAMGVLALMGVGVSEIEASPG